MHYSFTRLWARASVVVGAGAIVLALLIAAVAVTATGEEFDHISLITRVLAGGLVTLVGLLVGGTMIVAGQLVSVLLDQRDILSRILETLAPTRPAAPGGVPPPGGPR